MRQIMFSAAIAAMFFTGCVDSEDTDLGELESELAQQVFYEKVDNLNSGHLDGQNGWTSTGCMVVDDTVFPGNKYIKCQNGAGAWKPTDIPGGPGSYRFQVDTWPNVNVVNSTHGKLLVETAGGLPTFQVIVGCDNIRVAYGMGPQTAVLRTFPCGSGPVGNPPRYRVYCKWSTGGTELSCQAVLGQADPHEKLWIPLATPPLASFNQIRLHTFPNLPGATLFDKIHMIRE